MARKETSVKKYVVRLSAEKRREVENIIGKGKHSAQLLTKARILLKADAKLIATPAPQVAIEAFVLMK